MTRGSYTWSATSHFLFLLTIVLWIESCLLSAAPFIHPSRPSDPNVLQLHISITNHEWAFADSYISQPYMLNAKCAFHFSHGIKMQAMSSNF